MRPASSVSSFCHCESLQTSPAFAPPDLPDCCYFCAFSYSNYARLVMFSFGFQQAFQRGFEPDDEVFFTRVRILLRCAMSTEN